MEELKRLAAQLRCPDGEHGTIVGDNMNETNIGMTLTSIDALSLCNGEDVLEIGHGNGGHVPDLMSRAKDLHYQGIEISRTISDEAIRINKEYVQQGQARFDLYKGRILPYEDGSFDKVFTVNSIYFWEDLQEIFSEIARVLKPSGLFALTYADKSFMQTLPFTQYGFKLYEKGELMEYLKDTDLAVLQVIEKTERIRSKSGDLVDRKYYVLVFQKS